jgi:very-short-patch-repair endonuclease
MQRIEKAIARIAGRQDNVIERDQLLGAGLTRSGIGRWLTAGRMQRMHRGVYLIGPAPPTPMAKARAAVLACGEGAVLSHRSAAAVYGLLSPTDDVVDVTVVARNPGVRPGIRLHRVAQIPGPDATTTLTGLPITSVARTICDLAATESANQCEAAFQEALYRRVVTDQGLAAVVKREPKRRGAPVIRALLKDPHLTRSERERRLLRLIKAAGLPRPVTNVRVHGYLVDVYWPAHQLIVEFDGWGAHGHRLAFERDRKRDQVMVAAGIRVLRVTDRQLTGEPIALTARVAQSLR